MAGAKARLSDYNAETLARMKSSLPPDYVQDLVTCEAEIREEIEEGGATMEAFYDILGRLIKTRKDHSKLIWSEFGKWCKEAEQETPNEQAPETFAQGMSITMGWRVSITWNDGRCLLGVADVFHPVMAGVSHLGMAGVFYFEMAGNCILCLPLFSSSSSS